MNRCTYPSIHRQSGHCLTLHSISENCMRISFATGTVMKHDNGMYKDSKSCKVQMYWKGFHVVVHASTLLYCCSLIFWVIPVAVLMVRNIVPYLVITCKAYDVFMLLLCLTTEIPAVTDVLKRISCGWTCFNTGLLLSISQSVTWIKQRIVFAYSLEAMYYILIVVSLHEYLFYDYTPKYA